MGDFSLDLTELEMDRLKVLADENMQAGNFVKAEQAYSQAITCAEHLNDPASKAVYLICCAMAQENQGKIELAKLSLQECIELAEANGLTMHQAHAHFLRGLQERKLGFPDSAIQHFIKSLDAAYNCEDYIAVEMAFGSLGLVYLAKGWAEQASECFRQALECPQENPNKAAWMGSLGQCLAELGQLQEADDCYQQAFRLAKKYKDVRSQAVCCGSRGNILFEQDKLDEAGACYVQAANLSRQAQDQALEGIWTGNLGNTYRKQLKFKEAMESCRAALVIARQLKDAHSEAAHLDSLGDCLMAQGEVKEALAKYEEALTISKAISDRPGERIYLSNVGRAHQRMGQLEPAFDFLSRAVAMFDEQRARIKSDDLKTSFAAKGQDLYRDMVQVCLSLGRRVEALEYVGRAKSRAILDLLSNSPIDVSELVHGNDETLRRLVDREAQLRSQIEQLEKLYWEGAIGEDSGRRGATVSGEDTQNLYAEWRDVINQLRRRHPNYASLISVETLNFEEIKLLWSDSNPAIDKNTAVLEYYWTDKYLLAVSVWNGLNEPNAHFINDRALLEKLEEDLASFLEMSATECWEVPPSLCNRLYDVLVSPILKNLPDNIDRLILVPHSGLYRLPFGALHDGTQYLIERFALSFLPTTSLIPVLAGSVKSRAEAKTSGYLVSAISDYSATRQDGVTFSARMRSAAGLEDLSYTIEEAKTVFELGSKHTIKTKLLTNAEVKESLVSHFSEYPVVHFAGHAVFNPQEPMASGLVLADGSVLSAAAILQGNVLRTLCGKLLVLSACQTGVNMVTAGGEILGLARALMYAGMPNLVLSLWEVADRSTAQLMQEFYKTWKGGKLTIAQALRKAQQKAITQGQPIHAWAPFIHMGIE